MLSAVAYFFQKLIQPLKFIILICLIISIVLTPFNRVNAKENDSSLKDNEIHARFAAVIDADTNLRYVLMIILPPLLHMRLLCQMYNLML